MILRVLDPMGSLVYEEVLQSGTGPRNHLILTANGTGSDTLLIADDQQILAYTFE